MSGMTDPAGRPGDWNDRLLGWPAVKALTGISRTTAWRMQKAGDFPEPVVVSPGRVGWWESELAAWKRTRAPRRFMSPKPPTQSRPSRREPEPASIHPPSDRPTARAMDGALASASDLAPHAAPARRRSSKIAPGQIAFDFGP